MTFLGTRATRLMRENWRTPRALAEELYAIFTSKEPIELDDTLTIRVPEGRPAIRVGRRDERPGDREAPGVPHSDRTGDPMRTPPPRDRDLGTTNQVRDDGPRPTHRPVADDPARRRTQRERTPATTRGRPQDRDPLIEFDGPVDFAGRDPVRFSTPPVFVDRASGRETTIEQMIDESLQTRMLPYREQVARLVAARVISGTGRSYLAEIYEDGPDKPPILDDQGQPEQLPLVILYLRDDATLRPGTVVFPATKSEDTYYGQVPVWME